MKSTCIERIIALEADVRPGPRYDDDLTVLHLALDDPEIEEHL